MRSCVRIRRRTIKEIAASLTRLAASLFHNYFPGCAVLRRLRALAPWCARVSPVSEVLVFAARCVLATSSLPVF